MPFLRSKRILISALAVLIPASGRTLPQATPATSMTDLIQKIQDHKIALNYDDNQGYLRALLRQLNIPVSSQTLVFSKSSFQHSQIAPDAPRAVYFNDDFY